MIVGQTDKSLDTMKLESTGRVIYAYRDIIGIDPDGAVFSGYDDNVDDEDSDSPFTREERAELADYMIGLWTAYKERD